MSDSTKQRDPFDPASLRIDPAGAEETGVRRVLAHIRVGRPGPQEFFRLHGGPEHRLIMATLDLREDREIYAISSSLVPELASETKVVEMRLGITRAGTVFMWPLTLPSADGRSNAWNETARAAAEEAVPNWVRMKSNMSAGCYDISVAPSGLAEPKWPDISFKELLRIAFGKGLLIDSFDHPVSCPRIFWTPICPTGGIHDEVEHEPNRNQRCE